MEVVIRQNYNEMSKLAAQMVAELLNTKHNAVYTWSWCECTSGVSSTSHA